MAPFDGTASGSPPLTCAVAQRCTIVWCASRSATVQRGQVGTGGGEVEPLHVLRQPGRRGPDGVDVLVEGHPHRHAPMLHHGADDAVADAGTATAGGRRVRPSGPCRSPLPALAGRP